MPKTILLTGATDGIGLAAAEALAGKGHHLLLHGRNPKKLAKVADQLNRSSPGAVRGQFVADLSVMAEVAKLCATILEHGESLDVLLNNAGVLKLPQPRTADGLDARFAVNTLAPVWLAQALAPLLGADSRVINLSSAAQRPVDLKALDGKVEIDEDYEAYAQSKLALTMWSREVGLKNRDTGPVVIAVNPGSLLASKMVREGFGMEGKDITIGSDILVRLSLDNDMAKHSGDYFDNDAGDFGPPHADALNASKSAAVIAQIERTLERFRNA